MKLATLRDGSRDGSLIVVDRDLRAGLRVPHIAPNLQAALDGWAHVQQPLADAYDRLNGKNGDEVSGSFPIITSDLAAPLRAAMKAGRKAAAVQSTKDISPIRRTSSGFT